MIFLYKAIKTQPFFKGREPHARHEQSLKIFVYNFGMGLFYLFATIGFFFYFLLLFYEPSFPYLNLFDITTKIMWFGIFAMTFTFEYTKILKTRYVFTSLDIVVTIFAVFLLPFFPTLTIFTNIIFYPLVGILIFLLPSTYFMLARREKESIRVHSLFFGLGIFFLISSVLIVRHALANVYLTVIITWFEMVFRIPYDVFTTALLVFGFVLMAGYGSVKFFEELRWTEQLVGLYVYDHDSGVNMFDYQFKQADMSKHYLDELLISAGISGIVIVLGEMTDGSESLKIIEQENRKILIETGTATTCVLIVKENLTILRNKLEDFLRDFELIFEDTIKSWGGKLNLFDPAELLVQKHFET